MAALYQATLDDMDYDDEHNDDFYYEHNADDHLQDDSEEDTDDASEVEYGGHSRHARNNSEPVEIKEQMFQDKMANLKKQLDELEKGTHPEYVRRVKKLEMQLTERIRLNDIYRGYLEECVDRDFAIEMKAAQKEFEEKQNDLLENLITDCEERRKLVEAERHTMELAGDAAEVKPAMTRKLRRRPNDPVPVVEKRRKPTTGQLVLLLEEKDVENDLRLITRGKTAGHSRSPSVASNGGMSSNSLLMSPTDGQPLVETKIEDGKLLYERRWYHRGQAVYVEGRDLPKFGAQISAIGTEIIWVKKITDNSKVKIFTSHLAHGKVAIKRRAS